jgi:hypothetical protein
MSEVHFYVVAADVRRHCDDRRRAELPDQMACRDTIEIGHDDIHEDQIVLRAGLDLIHSFQTVKLRHISFCTPSRKEMA